MASEPVCRDKGLEFPHQAWVAFRESPLLFVSTLSIHTKCCYRAYPCWHRWINFLPCNTLWFINISMSWASVYQTLEHVLTPSHNLCHLYLLETLSFTMDAFKDLRYLKINNLLTKVWYRQIMLSYAGGKFKKTPLKFVVGNWIWMFLLNNANFSS